MPTIRQAREEAKKGDKDKKALRGWYVIGVQRARKAGEPWEILAVYPSKSEAEKRRGKVGEKNLKYRFAILSEYDPFAWNSQPELQAALATWLGKIQEKGKPMATLKQLREAATPPKSRKWKAVENADKERSTKKCACGCGEFLPKGSSAIFLRGHHVRLKGKIVRGMRKAIADRNEEAYNRLKSRLEKAGLSTAKLPRFPTSRKKVAAKRKR